MKHKGDYETVRWRDRPVCGTVVENRARDLILGALEPGEPDPVRLARVGHALLRPERPRRRVRVSLRLVVVATTLFACVATVKAFELARRAGWLGPTASLSPQTPAEESRMRTPSRRHTLPAQGQDHGSSPGDSAPSAGGGRILEPTTSDVSGTAQPRPGVVYRPGPVGKARPAVRTTAMRRPESVPTVEPERTVTSKREGAAAPTMGGESSAPPSVGVVGSDLGGSALSPGAAPQGTPTRSSQTEPTPVATPPRGATPIGGRSLVSPASRPAPTRPLSDEIRALDLAMALLRRDHDGGAALSALDDYLARYPGGFLNREARFARVDALLLLGRSEQALDALESLPLDRGRRSTELQVIRAELRSRKSCLAAEADFSAALDQGPSASLLERILYGRGVCRVGLGNTRGASSDFRQYLDRFPNGAHAESVRTWLVSAGTKSSHRADP